MAIDLNGIITWLKGWFYDKTEITSYLNNKANVSDLQTTNSNLTALQSTVDNKVDKVTGKSLSTEDYTSAEKTKLNGIEAGANNYVHPSTHATGMIVENNALSNIGLSAGSSQDVINSSFDSAIGTLSNIKAVQVVSTLPSASLDTMNRLYIVSENSKVNVYYTEENNGSYSWHKMDTDILDELSIGWSDITDKPFTSIDTATSTTSTNPITNKAITAEVDKKAPIKHAATAGTYGVGTNYIYGHNKVINNLTTSSYADGNSLSAYQGYVLKGLIDGLNEDLADVQDSVYDLNASSIPYSPSANVWGEESQVATNVSNALTLLRQILENTQRKGDCITSIELIPKSEDNTGAIRLYYGDET